MGYRRGRKTVTLRFETGDELEGLEVRARSLPLRVFKELMGIGEVDRSDIASLLDEFANCLISWNLEDEDGTPVPATPEAMQEEDHDLMLRLAGQWMKAMQGVIKGDPLPGNSPAGEQSPEASIPMAPLSESLAS